MEMEKRNQRDTLLKFQELIADLHQDDETCMRFLTARQFDLKKAEDMIRNSVRWRNEVDIENLYIGNMPTFLKEDFPCRFTGVSINGGPVGFLWIGSWKAKHWIELGKQQEITHYVYYYMEMCLMRMKELGDKQAVLIYDVKGLTYQQVGHLDSLKILYGAFQALEQNYPEILQNLIVVNAPWVFTIAYNFIKPILSARTIEKIQIYGSDKKQWLPVLRKLCLEDAIPKEYLDD